MGSGRIGAAAAARGWETILGSLLQGVGELEGKFEGALRNEKIISHVGEGRVNRLHNGN